MARIAGVDLPREKRVEIAPDLYLRHRPQHRRRDSSRPPASTPTPALSDLTESEVGKLRDYIDHQLKVEGDLRREVSLEHQAPDGDRLLSRSSPSPGPARARTEHQDRTPAPARAPRRPVCRTRRSNARRDNEWLLAKAKLKQGCTTQAPRERKTRRAWRRPYPFFFQQYHRHHHRYQRQRPFLGLRRRTGLPRIARSPRPSPRSLPLRPPRKPPWNTA